MIVWAKVIDWSDDKTDRTKTQNVDMVGDNVLVRS